VHTCTGSDAAHIHGPIADNAPIVDTANAGVWNTLTAQSLSAGGTNTAVYVGTFSVSGTEHTQFVNARFYVNIHTPGQASGCTRGQIYRAGVAGAGLNMPGPSHIAVLDQLQAGFGPLYAGDTRYDAGRVGVALLWNNPALGTLRTVQAFSGLSGNPVSAHIHGLQTVMTSGHPNTWFPNSAAIVWSIGTSAATTLASTDSFTAVTAAHTTNLNNGLYYYNVHTSANQNGEIRGQVVRSVCYPYTGMACPAFPGPAPGSSSTGGGGSTGSSTGTLPGSASTIAVSGLFFTVLAALVALLA
jgi:hypothetical protein